jgi:phospholipid/cholesterol/gamma-HCH transport system ATP-binding protein
MQVRGLTNSFGSQTVHRDLDLDVQAGEIIGVVGGSGTGKSVLMRAILGLRPPQAARSACSAWMRCTRAPSSA